ncbi:MULTISPECIES: TetR/AcrR family transcriptional regulator [Rhizobium/Agrobacterium group]|uniref:Transcriptional regulator protein n=2 Tax=Rhizobium/Agrobacterium group TaxID=227290 RepID=B9JZZ0_ALLAM|nr:MULTISPECIES: TetR/AcrR family transcriptional regulator [Rhizobium/Agrobacterium group]ACM37449.1 transcriptional regulator protein [Allorhizobium ampelinum S4]MCF1450582.1 TetR/AcrR family transcriptional regulator [Allorhizobium ampelinum]MCF1463507.1 TetR/AcrR family transcriptional regulator [Allorhizobium ampelinum]MCF1470749.1 TetR/AcrR family transcriptional regulator [Allorhizobium ampelinum]MCF1496461.1 TetR/AcrR family transcriptional regulator [Allorhizobium ampelinum]
MSSPYGNAEKRLKIVETAYGLFKRNGFHATGIDRIIDEADIAKMTMYRHFPTKNALIVEVLRYRAARFERQLDELQENASSPQHKIDEIFCWYERWFKTSEFYGCVFQHALAEFNDPRSQVNKAAVAQKLGLQERMRRILLDCMSPESAGKIATALLMLLEGATLLAQMGQGLNAIDDARLAAAHLVKCAGDA